MSVADGDWDANGVTLEDTVFVIEREALAEIDVAGVSDMEELTEAPILRLAVALMEILGD